MRKPIDPVVIRVWKDDSSDVFALFPVLPADNYGCFCTSYQHVGQHATADYGLCIRASRPASKAEMAALLAELRRHRLQPATDQTGHPCYAQCPYAIGQRLEPRGGPRVDLE